MTARRIDASAVAQEFRDQLRQQLARLRGPLTLAGFLATDAAPSRTYADYTRIGCEDLGIRFDLREVDKLGVEDAIQRANSDPAVHGIIVYYPIFGLERDRFIQDLVDQRKDIEGLNSFWARKLYRNQRFVDAEQTQKAILPCTALSVVKLLEAAGCMASPADGTGPLAGKRIAVFNRSEVVGRPLACMLANDGAEVYSFDIDGPLLFRDARQEATSVSRAEALATADIVITGVPSRAFPLVSAAEVRSGVVCVNFSTLKNFADDIETKASVFVPRVGPMTVAMGLRNTLRLYENFHVR
ncbi:MAG: bifunctional methylenetetrahydrofolate dehydrogenase/methenyltetrahydrofolate cyclohydrolase [Pseudomonadota bacterium]